MDFVNVASNSKHIRLNTKRLYLADGYAVKELLKLISILVEGIIIDRALFARSFSSHITSWRARFTFFGAPNDILSWQGLLKRHWCLELMLIWVQIQVTFYSDPDPTNRWE